MEKMKKSLNELKMKNMKGMQKLAFSIIISYLLFVLRSAASLDKTNEEQFEEGFRIVKECLTSLFFISTKQLK